jgi:hypothetical protein
VTEIRVIGEVIELDGVTVAGLLPNVRLSLRDQLVQVFDSIDDEDDDAGYIALLEANIARLEKQLKDTVR